MSHQQAESTDGNQGSFEWHPRYAGMTFERVHGDLAEEIGRDQRSFKLAMDSADQAEHDSLSTIVELERRWSTYDFDWAEMPAASLATKILNFEKVCETQKSELSFAEYRASGALLESAKPVVTEQPRAVPVMFIGIAILAVLVVILVAIILPM